MIAIIATYEDDLLYLTSRLTFLSAERELQKGVKTYHGFFGKEEVVMVAAGPSNYMSALVTNLVISRYDPDVVYSVGDCFALSPILSVGDLVIGTKAYLHGINYHAEGHPYGEIPGLPEVYPCSASQNKNALNLAGSGGIRAFAGAYLSGEKLTFDKDEFEALRIRRYAGIDLYAYDLSTAGTALACCLHKKPFLPIHVVSYVPGVEEGKLSYRRKAVEALPKVGRLIFGLCSAYQSKRGS